MRRLLALIATAAATLALTPALAAAKLPPVRHVFVIVLENENAADTFGPGSPAPYLSQTLTAEGQFLPNYYGVTHESLGNYIAMVSGQGSNVMTQADCQFYMDVLPGLPGPNGQAIGQGCVYPSTVQTIANQLSARHLTWKGYMEDMGNDPTRESSTCGHPAAYSRDGTQSATANDQYAARHNPFVYFHSIVDTPACAANDVRLDRLPADLASVATTANYSLITPNLCNDGHDSPCANGQPGGLKSADAFLRRWIPQITASPAYRRDGLIAVIFDEAQGGPGGNADATSCCSEPQFLNTPNNGGPTPGSGGGRVGAVLLSPFIRPGSVNENSYNHFSLLRSVEKLFHLPYLGYAKSPNPRAFGRDVFG